MVPDEQLNAGLLLKLGKRRRKGWLGDAQGRRGRRYRAAILDRHRVFDLSQRKP
jgi:hypothetical protein